MTLTVTTEPREDRQLAVTIEVPQERVDKELHKAATKIASEYRLPGFRKGKAPYHIVVQQFGIANLYNEFVDKLGEDVYKEALEQEKIEPYAIASLEDISFDPLTYKLVLPLEPIVNLNDYRAVRAEADATPFDETLVDAQIDAYLDERASWQMVERPSQYGDMLTIDVKSVIAPAAEGDEPIVVLDETDWDVTPDEENPMDPPGFDEALIGMTPGETKEFVLSWPAESQSIHAGKEATFNVTVKQIQAYAKPVLDDALAAEIEPETTTAEELRTRVRERLQEAQSSRVNSEYATKALDALVEASTLEYPPAVIEDQIDSMLRDYEMQLRQLGIESLDRFFEQTGQDRDDFRASLREQAVINARRNLVLSEIIRAEQLTVSDEEIQARADEMTQPVEDADEDVTAQIESMKALLASPTGRGILFNDLLRDKAVERVIAIARGEELPELAAPEAPAAEDEAAAEGAAAAEDEAAADEAPGAEETPAAE